MTKLSLKRVHDVKTLDGHLYPLEQKGGFIIITSDAADSATKVLEEIIIIITFNNNP
jgi:hypothetical protein